MLCFALLCFTLLYCLLAALCARTHFIRPQLGSLFLLEFLSIYLHIYIYFSVYLSPMVALSGIRYNRHERTVSRRRILNSALRPPARAEWTQLGGANLGEGSAKVAGSARLCLLLCALSAFVWARRRPPRSIGSGGSSTTSNARLVRESRRCALLATCAAANAQSTRPKLPSWAQQQQLQLQQASRSNRANFWGSNLCSRCCCCCCWEQFA